MRNIAVVVVAMLVGLGMTSCTSGGTTSGPSANDQAACSTLITSLKTAASGSSPRWGQVADKGFAADSTAVRDAAYRLSGSKSFQAEGVGIDAMKSACATLGLDVGYNENHAFVAKLSEIAPKLSHPDASRLEGLGHALCQRFNSGATFLEQVKFLDSYRFEPAVGVAVLGAAVDAYCPQFQPEAQTYAESRSMEP